MNKNLQLNRVKNEEPCVNVVFLPRMIYQLFHLPDTYATTTKAAANSLIIVFLSGMASQLALAVSFGWYLHSPKLSESKIKNQLHDYLFMRGLNALSGTPPLCALQQAFE